MSNYCQLYQIYYPSLISILNKYPNAEIGIRWRNENEFLYDIRIPDLDDDNEIRKLLSEYSNKKNFKTINEKLSIDELLVRLKSNKQKSHLKTIRDYLLYDIFSTKNEYELYYINNFKLNLSIYKNYDNFFSSYNENILENIHYSFFKFITLSKSLKESLTKGIKQNYFWSEIKMCLTLTFISLAGIIQNLINDNKRLKDLIESIKIDKYNRYRFDETVKVNTIYDLIKHFRDAVCHLENKSFDITKGMKGGNTKSKISGIGIDATITYGDGKLKIKEHLIPLIEGIKKLLLPDNLPIISIINKDGKVIFSDIVNTDESCPVENKSKVSKLNNNYFRIHFPAYI